MIGCRLYFAFSQERRKEASEMCLHKATYIENYQVRSAFSVLGAWRLLFCLVIKCKCSCVVTVHCLKKETSNQPRADRFSCSYVQTI